MGSYKQRREYMKRWRRSESGKTSVRASTARQKESSRVQILNRARWARHKAKYTAVLENFRAKPCADCGYSFPTCCMDFHHVYGVKKFNISDGRSWKVPMPELLKEIAKCTVICANCHRIRHAKQRTGTTTKEGFN
jgi:hypothetical protein